MTKLIVAAMTIVLATSVIQAADEVTLVRDGKSVITIVLANEASLSEKWAAEELRSHLKQMSGAAVAPAANQLLDSETRIYLGLEAVRQVNPQATIEKLGPDGFIIDVKAAAGGKGGEVHIYGTQPRGTLYGVYTLLESLGVRWWTPTVTHFPELKTVAVPVGSRQEVPRLEYRDMMYLENFSVEGKLWAARNKLNGFAWSDTPTELIQKVGGRYRFHGNLVHSYGTLLKASGVAMEPEMQALVNDKRSTGQPCLTNPKVLETITAQVIKIYKNDPELHFVVVGQDDNNNYCRCPTCQKLIDAEGESGPVIQFANQVAELVEKEVPGAIITTAAYNWSRVPPKTLRPRHNVYITLCSIECDFGHPLATAQTEVNVKFRENIQIWSKITNKLMIWDYVTNYWGFILPQPNFDVLVPNIKFFADMGAAGVFEQAAHKGTGSDLVQLRMWVLAKGLWNPEADNWALINEFVDGYYGPAAPGIKAYLEAIHKPIRQNQDFVLKIYLDMDAIHLAPEPMAEAEVALRQAAEAAKGNAEYEKRVRHARMGVWYVTLARGPQSNLWKAIEAKTGEKIDIVKLAAEFAATAKESNVTMIADDEVISHFIVWAQDYAAQVAKSGVPLPPEFKDGGAVSMRVIQGCQMDRRSRWFQKAEGASDGWAIQCPTIGWTIRHAFDAANDFEPGKTYRLMARVKGTPVEGASGSAWQAGVSTLVDGKHKHVSKKFTAEEMTSGVWQTVEVLRWKPQHGDLYWIALSNDKVLPVIYQDCMWLEPVSE